MTRVLLFSPVAGRDPAGGDITYTRLLVEHPPPGVVYTTYDEAIRDGSVVVRGRRPARGSFTMADLGALAARLGHRLLADRLLYREPPWFVSIDPDAFDLVHQHLFSVRQLGAVLPSVSTCGMPLSALYENRELWSARKTKRADRLLALGARLLKLHVPGVWPGTGGVLTGYTPHYCERIAAAAGTPVLEVGQGLPPAPPLQRPSGGAVRFAFVGGDFERKGGPLAVSVMTELLRLGLVDDALVVTRDPAAVVLPPGSSIRVQGLVAQQVLLTELLPTVTLLLLPSSADCGLPYTVLEALSAGASVAQSDSTWLAPGVAGPALAVGARTARVFVEQSRRLLAEPEADRRRHATELLHRFDMTSLHRQLLAAYEVAASQSMRHQP